jgi:hypothetical protein
MERFGEAGGSLMWRKGAGSPPLHRKKVEKPDTWFLAHLLRDQAKWLISTVSLCLTPFVSIFSIILDRRLIISHFLPKTRFPVLYYLKFLYLTSGEAGKSIKRRLERAWRIKLQETCNCGLNWMNGDGGNLAISMEPDHYFYSIIWV